MSDDTPLESLSMAELIELSSFGTDEARHRRHRTPSSVTRQLLANLTRQLGDDERDGTPAAPAFDAATPYFYLSYARDPAEPGRGEVPDVRRFFRLLCTYLSQLAADIASDESGPSPSMVPGYLAGEPSGGPQLQPRMLNALSSCRVFVPLLSAGYLGDVRCQGEWASFRRRDDVRRQHHPFGLSAIVPVLWEPMTGADFSEWVSDVQVADATLGGEYVRRGIRALMVENSPAYPKAVFRIARRIHDVAECLPTPGD
jgi:hypothetical protein